ncbi:hypothetical protein AB685_04170 [Bacillus sp. LL01]|uniref:hypothetical protein n=1 Tax=Bacillus sp. LL01 TaxID=1665556 RepID=UPI00064CFBA6|nr:hypothetical protein [Bacillus sp. LL01]KMJ60042.1 hypothetical protein AB685_04170 [Bacillus sp. LL01]
MNKTANLQELICEYEIDPEVIQFLEFDEAGYIDDLMQENVIYMTDDVLNDYVQNFTQQAFEIKLKMNELLMHRMGLLLLIPF